MDIEEHIQAVIRATCIFAHWNSFPCNLIFMLVENTVADDFVKVLFKKIRFSLFHFFSISVHSKSTF